MTEATEGPLSKAMSEAIDNLKCWALHIEGPDDLIPAPSKHLAQFAADVLNRWFDGRTDKHEFDPVMRAQVVEWTLGYERWKAGSEQFADHWADWVKRQDAARTA
jgi:hypothetical protein